MNLKEFAQEFGVIIGRCEPAWGGTFSYCIDKHTNITFNGYKTEKKAYEGWLEDTFDSRGKKAILKLIKQSEKAKPKLSSDGHSYSDGYRL